MSLPPAQPPDTYPCNPDSSYSHFIVRQYTPEAITAAYPIVVTITSHGFTNGQAIRATKFITMPLASASGMEQLNNHLFYVQKATSNTFVLSDVNSLPIDGRNFTTYVSGGQFTLVGPTLPIENPTYDPPPGNPAFPPE